MPTLKKYYHKLKPYIPEFDEKLAEFKSRIEDSTSEFERLMKIKQEEDIMMKRNFRYDNID